MRVLMIALLGLVLAGPVWGQQAGQNATSNSAVTGPVVFGSANCLQNFSCPNRSYVSASDLHKYANSCVAEFFGFTSPDGLFEKTGLGGDNCLTTKPRIIPKGMGAQLTPRCCVIPSKTSQGMCAFHCDMITEQE